MRTVLFVTILCATLMSASTYAGSLQVDDQASLFSDSDRAIMHAVATQSSFEVRVLSTVAATPQHLEYEAGRLVTSQNTIVIAIDPKHRTTHVRYGTGTGIPVGYGTKLAKAGGSSFASKRLGEGIVSIISAAQNVQLETRALSLSPSSLVYPRGIVTDSSSGFNTPQRPYEPDDPGHPVLWTLFLLCSIAAGAWWIFRRYHSSIERRMNSLEYDIDNAKNDAVVERDFNSRLNARIATIANEPCVPRSEAVTKQERKPATSRMIVHEHHHNDSGLSPSSMLAGVAIGSMLSHIDHQHTHHVVQQSSGGSSSWSSNTSADLNEEQVSLGGGSSWEAGSNNDDQQSSGGSSSWSDSSPSPSNGSIDAASADGSDTW